MLGEPEASRAFEAALNRFENLVCDCQREGDTELARVNDALDFQFAESIDELVAKISGSGNDADFSDAETQDNFLILAPDIEQVDVGKDAVLGGRREGHGQSDGRSGSRVELIRQVEGLLR